MLRPAHVLLPCLIAAGLVAQPAPKAAPALPANLWMRMTEDLTRMDNEVDGRVGVYVRGLDSPETFSLRGDEVFPTASTIKVAILLELYRQAEAGRLRLTDVYEVQSRDLVEGSAILGNLTPGTKLSLRDLALFMVVVSDNTASNLLMERVGLEHVNTTLRGLGLGKTQLRRKMMDLHAAQAGRENLSSPHDLGELLVVIQGGKLLSEASRADLLRLLVTPKDGFLTRLLPEDLVVANKPGTLVGVRNDVGIIFVKGRPFVLAIMSSHLRDERQAEDAIARMARRAAACFEMAGATSPEGRVFGPLLVH